MNKGYQLDYASKRPQMYDKNSRIQKAKRIIKTLQVHLGKNKLKNLTVLDIGASSGIIDSYLSPFFKKVVGTDIDKEAIGFARKNFERNNLIFKIEDALSLSFKNNSFDIVICTHIYEHVSNPQRLFDEIYRVLKHEGICYFAGTNKFFLWEPHYNLPFLSWFPKPMANFYVHVLKKSNQYYESPKNYWELKKYCQKFKVFDITTNILRNPKKYGYEDKISGTVSLLAFIISPFEKFLVPTFFWILRKENQ